MALPALLIDVKLLDCCRESGKQSDEMRFRRKKMPDRTHRCRPVDKLHKPMGWIGIGEEIPSREKRVS